MKPETHSKIVATLQCIAIAAILINFIRKLRKRIKGEAI